MESGDETIRFDAMVFMPKGAFERRLHTFQPFHLHESGSYGGKYGWYICSNQDKDVSLFDSRDRQFGQVQAIQFRYESLIVSVDTTSEEFAQKFSQWLRENCRGVLLNYPYVIMPQKRLGRAKLECNNWAYKQVAVHRRRPKEILEEWKKRYQDETGNDPDIILANPLQNLRQAISGRRRRR